MIWCNEITRKDWRIIKIYQTIYEHAYHINMATGALSAAILLSGEFSFISGRDRA